MTPRQLRRHTDRENRVWDALFKAAKRWGCAAVIDEQGQERAAGKLERLGWWSDRHLLGEAGQR